MALIHRCLIFIHPTCVIVLDWKLSLTLKRKHLEGDIKEESYRTLNKRIKFKHKILLIFIKFEALLLTQH